MPLVKGGKITPDSFVHVADADEIAVARKRETFEDLIRGESVIGEEDHTTVLAAEQACPQV